MTSQNINIVFKRNPTNGSAMSYSPSTHAMPAIFQHRDSFVHQRELESNFCSDLICCGTHIKDLHELLHHYEEHHHAPIEEEGEKETEIHPMEDIDYPANTTPTATTTSLPAHEVASVAPLLRSFDSFKEKPERLTNNKLGRHTEEILKQALPNLVNSDHMNESGQPDLRYFSTEVLYQTCDRRL
ncbi:hypothetical protein G6F56_006233 [Rhizopus delemar]|nr:hypothetical protein G6F56_006233 [Rhizopus delemar]